MDEQPDNKAAQPEARPFSKVVKVIAYPFSAVVGAYVGYAKVRRQSYEDFKGMGTKDGGMYADIRSVKKVKEDALLENVLIKKTIHPEEFPIKKAGIYKEHLEGVIKRNNELGFESIFKRFGEMSRNHRIETVLAAFTGAAISLGVLLTVADNKFLLKKINMADPNDNDVSP